MLAGRCSCCVPACPAHRHWLKPRELGALSRRIPEHGAMPGSMHAVHEQVGERRPVPSEIFSLPAWPQGLCMCCMGGLACM